MPFIARIAATTVCVAALAGIASAAIDWGVQYQGETGPACWIDPRPGYQMAWTENEPHFQTTAGGPVLAMSMTVPPGEQDEAYLIKADRIIRAAAGTEKIAIGISTILMVKNQNQPSDGPGNKLIVAVPVMPGETKSPQPAWGITRIDFPSTKVGHTHFIGSMTTLNDAIKTLDAYVAGMLQSPEGKGFSYGMMTVIEFYDLERDLVAGSADIDICIQIDGYAEDANRASPL